MITVGTLNKCSSMQFIKISLKDPLVLYPLIHVINLNVLALNVFVDRFLLQHVCVYQYVKSLKEQFVQIPDAAAKTDPNWMTILNVNAH